MLSANIHRFIKNDLKEVKIGVLDYLRELGVSDAWMGLLVASY